MLAQAVASGVLSLLRCRAGGPLCSSQLTCYVQGRENHWQSSLLALGAALPMRAEPRKKKKVDPRRDQAMKDRMRKKLKKLEKAPQELIPIEDFITPFKYMDEKRVRATSPLSFEESERRALLMKKWSVYKQQQREAEMETIQSLLKAQEKALNELRLESEELYQAAIQRDDSLFPFEREEPMHTPPLPKYEAPEGKCNDVTRVYTQ
ncbi:PREDICTED: 39S ribosomal protein L40, mitochondrial [Gekko japonicus]|uniref:Large ribosomal subunit protein mL40 n=1 Tax=Gekko japonicus TaxID=146911 RepID=A0ABM1KFA6_GEKJA|nr:PREDICTED: 39S ribosomal protein L40, mitochondrial [Gekko japonicus]